MKTLQQFILEAYNKVFNTADEYIDYFKGKYKRGRNVFNKDGEDFVHFMMDELWDGTQGTQPFVISDPDTAVKVMRMYRQNEKMMQWFAKHPELNFDPYQETFFVGGITFKWGNGNVKSEKSKSLPTDIQEQVSCDFFNRYFKTHSTGMTVDEVDTDGWDKFDEYFSSKNYKEWVVSWVEQFNNICEALKGWNNAVAVRYGDTNDKVASKLLEIHKAISSLVKAPKDTFDPSDILIYDRSSIGEILNEMDSMIEDVEDADSIIKAGVAVFGRLYHSHKYIGVSIKKGKSFRPVFMNFEPAIGFENASLRDKMSLDPVYGFFGYDDKMVAEFEERTKEADEAYYKDIVKNCKRRNKSCVLYADCDDHKNIDIAIRTNQQSYHPHLVIEPKFKKAKAQIGKVPTFKWMRMLTAINPDLQEAFEDKKAKYDVDGLCKKWDYIRTRFKDLRTTSKQLRHLYEIFASIDRKLDNELYSYSVQINILYALLQGETSTMVRSLLLWAEKVDDDCLPYLLIKPN